MGIVFIALTYNRPMVELLAGACLISLTPLLLAMLGTIVDRVFFPLREGWTASAPASDWLNVRQGSGAWHKLRWRRDSSGWEPERWGR